MLFREFLPSSLALLRGNTGISCVKFRTSVGGTHSLDTRTLRFWNAVKITCSFWLGNVLECVTVTPVSNKPPSPSRLDATSTHVSLALLNSRRTWRHKSSRLVFIEVPFHCVNKIWLQTFRTHSVIHLNIFVQCVKTSIFNRNNNSLDLGSCVGAYRMIENTQFGQLYCCVGRTRVFHWLSIWVRYQVWIAPLRVLWQIYNPQHARGTLWYELHHSAGQYTRGAVHSVQSHIAPQSTRQYSTGFKHELVGMSNYWAIVPEVQNLQLSHIIDVCEWMSQNAVPLQSAEEGYATRPRCNESLGGRTAAGKDHVAQLNFTVIKWRGDPNEKLIPAHHGGIMGRNFITPDYGGKFIGPVLLMLICYA